MKGNSAATMKDPKVGEHVVIHATRKGDSLVAAEERVGEMKMKEMSHASQQLPSEKDH